MPQALAQLSKGNDVVWWRKKNDGFEWRDYVRTTILVRREHRRQRLKDVQGAAAANVKKAGKRSVEAGVSGSRKAASAVWHHGRAAAGTLSAWGGEAGRRAASGTASAARWTSAAASALGERAGRMGQRAGKPLAPVLDPLFSFLDQTGTRVALAAVAVLTGLGAAYRTWGFGFDADARLAAIFSVVSTFLLLIAVLRDPRRQPLIRDRDSLLTRLGARGRTALASRPQILRPTAGIIAASVAVLCTLAAIWHVLPSSTTSTTSPPDTTGALPDVDPSKLEGRAVAVTGDRLRIAGTLVTLDGIEAPEPAQQCTRKSGAWRCGAASKDTLAALLRNRRISCDVLDDSTSGKRARCYVEGSDVAEELVRRGSVFSSGGFLSRYSGLESDAQDQKVGVWSGEADRPKEFRDKRWAAAKKSAPDGCPIKGRIRSGARTYVLPWATGYESIKLRTSRGERWFCSEQEAEDAGWSRDSTS
jgi:endonuclease YncB( thermonuclease family)